MQAKDAPLQLMTQNGISECVLNVYPTTKEIQLKFLHPEGPARSYHYPHTPDIILVDSRDVLHVVDPTTVTGRAYSL